MLEREIEKRVSAAFEARGWFQFKIMQASKRGIPDRCFIRQGRVIFIEFKSSKGVLSANQTLRIAELRKHGATVHIINSVDHGLRIAAEYDIL